MKKIYATLCILGFALPYSYFLSFLRENGLDFRLFVQQLFANDISAFFGADVIVSSLALWAFIYYETRKLHIPKWWLCILANLTVGVSLALPLFLLFRESAKEKT